MCKSRTFDLKDITKELLEEVVFFDISYPAMGDPGCVIFLTKSGTEYIISQEGTDLYIKDIVQLFPEIYEIYDKQDDVRLDEHGFKEMGRWKILPAFCGELFVREDFFERFYDEYQKAREIDKDLPLGIVRKLFGKENKSNEMQSSDNQN